MHHDDADWGTVQPEAWKAHAFGGIEPLPDEIVQAARDHGLDVNALHTLVEGEGGWESHDVGYASAVARFASKLHRQQYKGCMSDDLRAMVKAALEGPSNEPEHLALVEVAREFEIEIG